jgi:hypothetical protein
VEQASFHLALEVAYLQAQRWLADADAFSSSAEMFFGRNRQEITNVTQFHKNYDRPPAEIITLERLLTRERRASAVSHLDIR